MKPLVLAEPERPFWGFAELLLAAAVFLGGGEIVIEFASRSLHAPVESGLWSVLEEAIVYAVLFLVLKMVFARHGKGLLKSLAWSKQNACSTFSLAGLGIVLSLGVAVMQIVLRTPDVVRPFDKLLDDAASRMAVGIFSITLGPMVEELLFRGFLQPVLVNAAGVFRGILITSVLFGGVHLAQYGNAWQVGVLLMVVGFVFGTVAHLTGSTRASTIVHIAFNAVPFVALLAAGNPLTVK